MIKLEFINGPLSGEHRVCLRTPIRMGCDPDCDVVLKGDTGILPMHACLRSVSGRMILEAYEGGGPVRVNGHVLQGEAVLECGDRLLLGETEIVYRWIEPPRPESRRRRSALEWTAAAMAAAIVLSQAVFLVLHAPAWRSRVDVSVLRPVPAPVPDPLPPAEAADDAPPDPGPLIPSPPPPAPLPPDPLPEEEPTNPEPQWESLSPGEQLARVREWIRDRNYAAAGRRLEEMLTGDPGFLAAQLEFARLMGRQSRFEESLAAWERVQSLAEPGSAEAREAALELPLVQRRLRQLQRPMPEPPPPRDPPAPRPAPPGPTETRPPAPLPAEPLGARPQDPGPARTRNPSLLVQDIQMQRFADQSVLDMREIRFTLQHVFGARPVPEGRARAVARFYETDGQRIFPANVPTPEVTMRINRPMSRGESLRDNRVIYQVPRAPRGPLSGRYYGVVIRVYVDGHLEHEQALPASLLQISR